MKEFRTFIQAFCSKELTRSHSYDRGIHKKLGQMGLLGITASEDHGGLNRGYLHHVVAVEEISRVNPSVGLSYAAHSNLCVNQIKRNASTKQQLSYLPKLISGECVGALAMSEPEAGSDVMSMRCTATKRGNDYVLCGSKMWITNGPIADVVFLYARTASDVPKSKAFSAFIVHGNQVSSRGTPIDKLGMRGSGTCELHFENVILANKQLVGTEGDGAKILMSGLDYERLVLAGGPLGIMQACLDAVIPYVRDRHQFGQPIGSFQQIQTKIATMYTTLQASRTLVYSLAEKADQRAATKDDDDAANSQGKFQADCAAAILFSSEAATQCALDAVQCLGGNGYSEEYPVAGLLRDAKLYEIGAGTNEIRREIIAKQLLSQ